VNLWVGISALLSLLVLVGVCSYFRGRCDGWEKGYESGHENGYCLGRTDSNLWWAQIESEVYEARQEIWRDNS
jgi:hypothetical protein